MYEQPALAVADPERYAAVKADIEAAFSASRIEPFLRSLEQDKLRIRDFEAVLARNLLGHSTQTSYSALGNSDQGQIREFYLANLERIPATLREKFFRLYAYY